MELLSKKRNPEHEKLYAKYYELKETPVRGITLIHKQEVIDAVKKNSGYFALLSNTVKNPLDALGIYRSKDVIEKAFGNLKERLNMRRTSVSSSENLEGKLFVQFIALIYLSYIEKAMSEKDLHKKYTTQELLDESLSKRLTLSLSSDIVMVFLAVSIFDHLRCIYYIMSQYININKSY